MLLELQIFFGSEEYEFLFIIVYVHSCNCNYQHPDSSSVFQNRDLEGSQALIQDTIVELAEYFDPLFAHNSSTLRIGSI